MADPQPRKIDEQISYNRVFLVCALLFGGVTMWAVYDEVYYRRPWKDYQLAFFQLDARLARQDAEDKKKSFETSAEVKKLREEKSAIEADLAGPKRGVREKAEAELQQIEFAANDAEQAFTFAKSKWEEAYYFYTVAKHAAAVHADEHHQDEARAADEQLQARAADMAARDKAFKEVAAKRAAKREELATLSARLTEVDKALERLGQAAADAARKADTAGAKAGRSILSDATEIQQYNLEAIGRVDRCVTCHMGIDRAGLDTVSPETFRTHPLRRTLFKYHPPDQFGCTSCHDG